VLYCPLLLHHAGEFVVVMFIWILYYCAKECDCSLYVLSHSFA